MIIILFEQHKAELFKALNIVCIFFKGLHLVAFAPVDVRAKESFLFGLKLVKRSLIVTPKQWRYVSYGRLNLLVSSDAPTKFM